MLYADLDEARRHYAALKELLDCHRHGGPANAEALRRIEELCWKAAVAVDDAECRECIGIAGDYAAEMLSPARQRVWSRQGPAGADFLRLRIRKALDDFRSRLYSIEAIRRAGARKLPPFSSASDRP